MMSVKSLPFACLLVLMKADVLSAQWNSTTDWWWGSTNWQPESTSGKPQQSEATLAWPTSGFPAPHAPRPCGCTPQNIWLDFVIAFDTSDSMTQTGLNQAISTFAGYFGAFKIDQTTQMVSRLGIVYYSDTARTLAPITAYTSTAAAVNGIHSVPYVGTHDVNIAGALRESAAIFAASPRVYKKRVLILVASANQIGAFEDPTAIANQLKNDGVTLITVAFRQGISGDIPQITFGSPGLNLTTADPDFGRQFLNGLCDANCFCQPVWTQFVNYNQVKFGECLYPGESISVWNEAKLACQRTPGGYLVDELSPDKKSFAYTLAQQKFPTANPFVYWIGLNSQSGVFTWDRGLNNSYVPLSPGDYTNWASGNPNGNGQCIAERRTSGFLTQWTSTDCGNPFTANYNYLCQVNACDTDTWCF